MRCQVGVDLLGCSLDSAFPARRLFEEALQKSFPDFAEIPKLIGKPSEEMTMKETAERTDEQPDFNPKYRFEDHFKRNIKHHFGAAALCLTVAAFGVSDMPLALAQSDDVIVNSTNNPRERSQLTLVL